LLETELLDTGGAFEIGCNTLNCNPIAIKIKFDGHVRAHTPERQSVQRRTDFSRIVSG
jgi:hypothetical protein